MAPKRGAPAEGDESDSRAKRLCRHFEYPRLGPVSADLEARAGLQRALCLVLDRIGFDAATPEALEEFTFTVETYIRSFVEELKRFSIASRREQPTPVDFVSVLRGFNLPIRSLKPHLRPPIRRDVLFQSDYYDPLSEYADESYVASALPITLLGDELSGRVDKDSKEYIPSSFPDFPSRHTYRSTAQEVLPGSRAARVTANVREEIARSAREAEDALRKLVRASKVRKQKEVRSVVGRDGYSRERYQVWEEVMRVMIEKQQRQMMQGKEKEKEKEYHRAAVGSGSGSDTGEGTEPGLVIADQSMIVNAEIQFLRREVARGGKRAGGAAI